MLYTVATKKVNGDLLRFLFKPIVCGRPGGGWRQSIVSWLLLIYLLMPSALVVCNLSKDNLQWGPHTTQKYVFVLECFWAETSQQSSRLKFRLLADFPAAVTNSRNNAAQTTTQKKKNAE